MGPSTWDCEMSQSASDVVCESGIDTDSVRDPWCVISGEALPAGGFAPI